MMTKSNIKIALRVLKNNKFYTALNIAGLAVGITCFFLTGFYVKQELSYDHFNTKKDRIYRLWLKEIYSPEKVFFSSHTPLLFETLMEENFGEVETAVQVNDQSYLVGAGENRINEQVGILSPEIFEVFDFKITAGNRSAPLGTVSDVILSQSYARKYFGDQSAIGKTLPIEMNGESREFIVSAVYEDIPKESSVQFDMAISNENNATIYNPQLLNAWFSIITETYVLIKEDTDIANIEANMQALVLSHIGDEVDKGQYNIGFQPLTDIHLNPDIPVGSAPIGNPGYVAILGSISILVLIMACINFTTLSVGQSLKRTKEVGVRKVMGAFRKSLINQYLTESLLIIIVAFAIGLGLTYASLPIFNELTNANVQISFEPWHLALYIGLILIIGISSGIYPALILSRLKATTIFRGTNASKGKQHIRKGMVIFQFLITVFLISSTFIMRKQLNFLQDKDTGIRHSATVSVPLYREAPSRSLADAISSAMNKGNQLKEKLSLYPDVTDLGMASHVFGSEGWTYYSYTDETDTYREFRALVTDPYYLTTFGIDAKLGRLFDPESELDKKQAVILNEAAVKHFNLDDPIGSKLPGNRFGEHIIIGVTEDFNYASLHTQVEPLVITQNIEPISKGIDDLLFDDSPIPKLVFRYSGKDLSKVGDLLKSEWSSVFPEEELNFSFVEENLNAQYANEQRMNRLLTVATVLSIIIAGLGLLGLTVLVAKSKQKEIGIRKVIGASEFSIFKLMIGSFTWQLLIGVALSVPITYWLMNDWLSDFAYRIDLDLGIFLLGAGVAMLIALLTISFHTIKASMINPIKIIRLE